MPTDFFCSVEIAIRQVLRFGPVVDSGICYGVGLGSVCGLHWLFGCLQNSKRFKSQKSSIKDPELSELSNRLGAILYTLSRKKITENRTETDSVPDAAVDN